jgi:transcriptional regulator of heat shock response
MITQRQGEILIQIVREYINSARPVSSQLLEKKYGFGIKPAMIRIEMQRLTEKGYLYQPHPSAGRVPTDKGYRFFVDGLLKEGPSEFEEDFEIEDWFVGEIKSTIKFIQWLTKNLALASSALALSYFEKEKIFWKEGWERILKEPEFKEEDCIINFTKLLEDFEKNIENLEINSGIKIFIGRENPFKKAKDFSIISSKCCLPEGGEGIISLLGPKRMAYDRNIALINSFKKIIENL